MPTRLSWAVGFGAGEKARQMRWYWGEVVHWDRPSVGQWVPKEHQCIAFWQCLHSCTCGHPLPPPGRLAAGKCKARMSPVSFTPEMANQEVWLILFVYFHSCVSSPDIAAPRFFLLSAVPKLVAQDLTSRKGKYCLTHKVGIWYSLICKITSIEVS